MDYVEEVIKLAGSPDTTYENPDEADWNLLESKLDRRLPGELKSILSTLGSGYFGLDFYLLNPKSVDATQLSLEKFYEYCALASPLIERVNLSLFPSKNGALRVGHLSTRKDLFIASFNDRWMLRVCDYDEAVLIDVNLGVAEFIYKLYKEELPSLFMQNLRRTIWCVPNIPFFSPHQALSFLLEDKDVRRWYNSTNEELSLEERIMRAQHLLDG